MYKVYIPPKRNNCADLVLDSVRMDGLALRYASPELKSNLDIVMAAVNQEGEALYYANEEFRNNFDIVMAAVKQNGQALKYASEELKNNYDIVFTAVTNNVFAFQYASEQLKNNISLRFIEKNYPKKYKEPIYWAKVIELLAKPLPSHIELYNDFEGVELYIQSKLNNCNDYSNIELPMFD